MKNYLGKCAIGRTFTLKGTQQIITTHDRLFWERICNSHKSLAANGDFSSTILQHTNKGIVLVDYDSGFLSKINQALEHYDIRQALVYCRIWIESMVSEFCVENSIEVTAKFTSRQRSRKDNSLELSLEKTYEKIIPFISWDSSNFDYVKNDLINWKGQNQGHHAFDESNLNFSHSKTSLEVATIRDKIFNLETQLFPERVKIGLIKCIESSEKALIRHNRKLDNPEFISNALPDIVTQEMRCKESQESKLEQTEVKLEYVEKSLIQRQLVARND